MKILNFGLAPPPIRADTTAIYSLIGKPEEAIYYLTKSLECGFAHRQYL